MRVPNPPALSDDRRSQSSHQKPTIGHRKPTVAAAAPPTTPERRGAARRSPSAARGTRTPPPPTPTPTPSSGKSWIKSLFRAIRCRSGDPETGAYPATKPSPSERVLRSPLPTPLRDKNGSSRGGSSMGRRSGKGTYSGGSYHGSPRPSSTKKFTLTEIQRATKNFSPALKIGRGGFGTVYRGTLDDGTLVAVKRAEKKLDDTQLGVEFQSEIKTLGRVEHFSLVKFYGCLDCDGERIVVIEYVPNGTLREHLEGFYGSHLDLTARLDIAIDVAHAVTYLHTYTDHPIIHRDIKSSNILLTETLRAKVADFGFARFGTGDTGVTHISTQVRGTAGYLDPEYLKTYQLTEKSDVYSFGVLLVELVSGRRPIETKREHKERITAKWAMKKFTEGNAIETLDPNLSVTPATNLALEKILEVSLQCLAPTRQQRPSMRRCAEILWNIRKDYWELLSSDPISKSSHHLRKSSTTLEKI
uniref:non-specific serine/threonine protein kinase n=1 Tax=Ananas comosus var. bracteatus TaxID=296719 RepID=A0A6V7NRT5_ANACO|nr:unnamed protein product [Ananas comosus var. bracteatus]